jgi:ABC-type transporter Mla subunit MlaD
MRKILWTVSAIVLLLFISCSKKRTYKLYVLFDKVDNLYEGAEVKMNGIQIGKVKQMELYGDSVLVDMSITRQYEIPAESNFKIINSLIGGATVSIYRSDKKSILKSSDTVRGSYMKEGLLDSFFADSLNRQKAKEAIEKIVTGLKELEQSKRDSAKK